MSVSYHINFEGGTCRISRNFSLLYWMKGNIELHKRIWKYILFFNGKQSQAKGIRKQDPEANIWTQERWELGVEKALEWGTS